MTDSVTIEIERDPPARSDRALPRVRDAVFTGVVSNMITRQRFASCSGGGFVVNVN